jgi:hypothetical protein
MIVVQLEVIDVDHDHGDGSMFVNRSLPCIAHSCFESLSIQQSREPVECSNLHEQLTL